MSQPARPDIRAVPRRHRAAFESMFVLEHFLRRSRRVAAGRDAARRRLVADVRRGGPGRAIAVDRRTDLSAAEFRDEYLRPGIPVVLSGAARRWPLMERWSFDRFRARYGHETIKLVQREGLTDDDFVFDREYSEDIRFADFLDIVEAGGRKYMRFSPLLEQFPELLDDFDHQFFDRMIPTRWGQSFQLFIGGAGTITPFHNAMTPFLFTNVAGRKHWTMMSSRFLGILNPQADGYQYNHSEVAVDLSNADRFPGLESIDHYETTTEPGDLLFVPSWMWHAVRNESATIGVRCGFLYPFGALKESPTLAFIRVFAAKPSLLQWFYYSRIRTNLPDRTDHLITPKWFRTEAPVRATEASVDDVA